MKLMRMSQRAAYISQDSRIQTNPSAADIPNYKVKLTLGVKPFRRFDPSHSLSVAQILIFTAVATLSHITITNPSKIILSFLSEPLERSDFK
jgi:hypothetical protein